MNYYIISFDRRPGASYKDFNTEFVAHPKFERWFHYIKSSYIVGTGLSAEEVSDHFRVTAERNGLPITHLVFRLVLRDRYGRLTKDAWKWLQDNTNG